MLVFSFGRVTAGSKEVPEGVDKQEIVDNFFLLGIPQKSSMPIRWRSKVLVII